jgi:hypothetical protein
MGNHITDFRRLSSITRSISPLAPLRALYGARQEYHEERRQHLVRGRWSQVARHDREMRQCTVSHVDDYRVDAVPLVQVLRVAHGSAEAQRKL